MSRDTLLLELCYEGAAFHGVHPQPGLRTLGGELAERVRSAAGCAPKALCFAARTDAGVSARQNFASMWFRDVPELRSRLATLDELGDASWAIKGAWLVPRSIHARNCARSKHYRYCFEHGVDPEAAAASRSARDGAWHVVPALDAERMQRAAEALVGNHDFSAFRAAGCAAKNTDKTLHRAAVSVDGKRVSFDVEGDAFLRKMVRILAGTLAEVGAGLRPVESISRLLEAPDRKAAGLTAPAHGLTLQSVELDTNGAKLERLLANTRA